MPIRHPVVAGDPSRASRLARIRRRIPDLTYLALLGFLSIPGYLVDSLSRLRVFVLFFLFGFWPLVDVFGDALGGDDRPNPTDWIDMGGAGANARAIVSMLVIGFQPILFVTQFAQMGGHIPILMRHRGRLPSPARHQSDVEYRLPFEGTWTVVNGSPDRLYSHSWGVLTQRYAHDFVITDEDGRTHEGERSGPEAHYCFGEPVLAPADGVVVAVKNDHRDYHRTDGWLDPLQRDLRGNYVTIDHGGEYSVLAHLQRGSVEVGEGQRVERGQRIGRCGHSGNSTEPHLHFHVQDHPNFFLGAGLPVRFESVETDHPQTDAEMHDSTYVHAGQRLRHVEE